ncbi:GNAT family N-acetyltransferase [Metabacillus indicus]|uniref:GNAT family N-acetyltransferase n=1 Tax=Metabacillus indicus TaxID=246786 RepID=UPI003CF557E8
MYEDLTVFQKRHREKAAAMLAESFHTNPLFVYLFPDEKKRRKVLGNVYKGTVEIVSSVSDVYVTSDKVEGIFAVRRTDKASYSPALYKAIIKTGIRSILLIRDVPLIPFFKKAKKLSVVSQKMAIYKKQKPHLVIDMVAVDPACRGQKFMSRMIRAALKEADSKKTYCVLETETLENVRIYEHFGFQLSQKIEVIEGQLTVYVLIYDPFDQTSHLLNIY